MPKFIEMVFLYKECCHSMKLHFGKFQSACSQQITPHEKTIRFLHVAKLTTGKMLLQAVCANLTVAPHPLAHSISPPASSSDNVQESLALHGLFQITPVTSDRSVVICSDPSMLLDTTPAQVSASLNPEALHRKGNHISEACGCNGKPLF